MNYIVCDKNDLISIADALREETNSEALIKFPNEFTDKISSYKNSFSNKAEITEYSSERNTRIVDFAFCREVYSGSCKIERVNVPNVLTLGRACFAMCADLQEVYAPLVENIDDSAFAYCSSLKSVDLPEVTTFGGTQGRVFYYCQNLEEVNIPKVTNLGNAANTSGSKMFAYCTNLKSVSAPSATTIGQECFLECKNLESVNLPLIAGSCGSKAFSKCENLKSVNMPMANRVAYQTFYKCYALENIELPSVTECAGSGFHECDHLTTAKFGAITIIQDKAFNGCPLLRTLVISQANSVCSLASTNAFYRSKIESGTGFIYVPDVLVNDYKVATNWSVYANQIKPLSEYVESTEV